MRMTSEKFAPWLMVAVGLALSSGGAALRADEYQTWQQPAGGWPYLRETRVSTPYSQPLAFNRASILIGTRVRNQAGENLGTLKDIVIDLSSARVSYAVVGANSGFLGLGEKLLAVPLKTFSTSTEKQYVVLNAEKSSVQQAMGFDHNHWPGLDTPAWGAEPFWKQTDPEPTKAAVSPGTIEKESLGQYTDEYNPETDVMNEDLDLEHQGIASTEGKVSGSGSVQSTEKMLGTEVMKSANTSGTGTEPTPTEPTKFNRAHSLIGMTVRNNEHEELGTIRDIVIDFQTERVSYVVLSRMRALGTTETLFAVPLTAFRPSEDQKYLVLNADKHSLETAQGFPADQWPSVSNPSWGGAPFWRINTNPVPMVQPKGMEKQSTPMKDEEEEETPVSPMW